MTKTLSTPIVVPEAVRRKAGLRSGDRVEFRVSGRVITIVRKAQTADYEYTPRQRRIIDAGLAKGEEDVKAGRVHGPFTAKQAAAFIEGLFKRKSGRLPHAPVDEDRTRRLRKHAAQRRSATGAQDGILPHVLEA